MITKFPYYAAPAFNELIVEDDTDTGIEVTEIGGRGRSLTLHHVKQNGVASFDLKNFVSKLFYDHTAIVATPGNPGWAFLDYRLQTRYAVGGQQFLALNAVQDKGHSLDLLDEGESGALTLRPIVNRRIEIPKYAGFPTGVSLMYKNMYGLDYSNATKAIIVTTVGNYDVGLPWYKNTGTPGGFISWGDGVIEEMTATVDEAAPYMRHTYSTPGQYEIAWIPVPGTVQNVLGSETPLGLTFATVVRTFTQFSDQLSLFRVQGYTGLQRIEGILPPGANVLSSTFRDCANLEYINPDLFLNVRAKITNLSYAFYGTTKLTHIDASLISGLTNVTTLAYCFYKSGITNFSAPMFALMAKVTDCSYTFYDSKIQAVSDGMFSAMQFLNNVTRMFAECKSLTSVGANVFNSSANTINASYICSDCPALKTIQSTSFNGLTNITDFSYAFSNCKALAALPSGVFSGMPKVASFNNGCERCYTLTSLPSNLFDSWTQVSTMSYAFYSCEKLNMNNPDIFKYNTLLTNLNGVFSGCRATTSIDANIFRNQKRLGGLQSAFANTGITSVPLGLFDHTTVPLNVTEVFAATPITTLPTASGGQTIFTSLCNPNGAFYNCASLTNIPADIFDVFEDAPRSVSAQNCFRGCSSVRSIPANLFTKAGASIFNIDYIFERLGYRNGEPITIPPGLLRPLVNVTNLICIFLEANITGIPADLFAGMPLLTRVWRAFENTRISTIPATLFASNPKLEDVYACFSGTPVSDIPATLFAHNPELKNVRSTFDGFNNASGRLTNVPESLFDNNPELVNVESVFFGQGNLTSVGNIFRYNPLITNFNSAFSTGGKPGHLTGHSPRTPEGYRLWERAGKPGYPATIAGTGCFRGNTALLTDGADVPANWK